MEAYPYNDLRWQIFAYLWCLTFPVGTEQKLPDGSTMRRVEGGYTITRRMVGKRLVRKRAHRGVKC